MRSTIAGFVNQTIRELHFDPSSGVAISYTRNLQELAITATVDDQQTWDFSNPQLFQRMEAVYYPQYGKYARQRSPSTAHAFMGEVDADYYYYRAGSYLVFSCYGATGAEIDLAYFEYCRKLPYYTSALNPVHWDEIAQGYAYLPAYDVDDTTRLAARVLCTNWMLETHEELIKEGARAKLYVRLSDVDRAKLHYSLYQSLRPGMVSSESYDSVATYSR